MIVWNFHQPNPALREYARLLYPGCKYLVSLRNPAQTLDSHFKAHFRDYPIRPFRVLPQTLLGQLLENGALAPGDVLTAGVRFEDLHLQPEHTMRAVAAWLGIAWDAALLRSTISGATWFHTKDGVEFSGARAEQARIRKTQYLTIVDRYALSYSLERNYAAWNYPSAAYERFKPLLRPLIARVALALPSGMEIAAFRHEGRELLGEVGLWLQAFRRERKRIRALLLSQRAAREGDYRPLPLLGADGSVSAPAP